LRAKSMSPVQVDLSAIFGPVYWGFVVATVLFGVSIVQGYLYYSKARDSWFLTLFVWTLLVLDCATTVLAAEAIRGYLIVNFGNPIAFAYNEKDFLGMFAVTSVVSISSQLFYASRIYIVNKRNLVIPMIIVILAVASFGCAIVVTMETFQNLLISGLESKKLRISCGLYSALAAACDIVATVSLCYFLASHSSAFRGTRGLLNHLVFFTVNRGVLVSAAQIAYLCSYEIGPTKGVWMPFLLSVAKLHLNTLLAMLNSRSTLRARNELNHMESRSSNRLSTFNAAANSVTQSTLSPTTRQFSIDKNLLSQGIEGENAMGSRVRFGDAEKQVVLIGDSRTPSIDITDAT